MLFDLHRTEESTVLNDEALQIAQEIDRKDVIFDCQILRIKVLALRDNDMASSELNKILKNTTDDRGIATIYDVLFTLTKDADVLSKTISLYEKIYNKFPNIEYKNRFWN
jgi:hypothetical protein